MRRNTRLTQLIRDSVPVVVAFTKFDQIVATEGGSSSRASARTRVEQSCHSLFRRDPRDVPAEIVSGAVPVFLWVLSVELCSDHLINS